MAKELRTVKAKPRTETGSGPARRLRVAGQVPAVIYGKGRKARSLTLERGDMERVISRGERLIKLDVEGKESRAMIKEVQYEPVSRLVAHIDFQEISATETISVAVPVRTRGTPVGTKEGGVLDTVMHEIEIECRADAVPEEIRLDVSGLNIGDGIRAGEVALPAGVKLVTDSNATVVAVEHPRAEEDAEAQVAAAEGGSEPEVLTGKKEEGAAPEAAAPQEDKGGAAGES